MKDRGENPSEGSSVKVETQWRKNGFLQKHESGRGPVRINWKRQTWLEVEGKIKSAQIVKFRPII